MPDLPPKSIAILGAGATGLAAAHRLARLGHRIRLFEASDRIGGAIRTEQTDGWLVEGGPNSLLGGDPALDALLDELGLAAARVPAAPAAKKRYLVRDGRPIAAPLSPPAFLRSPLISPPGKLRVLADLFARPRVRTTDLSLAAFAGSHFGSEFVAYVVDPFVSGVYAGDAAKLSARHAFPKLWDLEQRHGSLLRGQIAAMKARRARGEPAPGIFSFAGGVQTLTDALAARLPEGALARHARIDALIPGTPWNVIWHDGVRTRTETFDAVILALPAPALAQLRIGSLGERPLAALETVEHPPVSSLFLGFRREQVAHPLDGFGLLVPAIERRALLGVLFSSSLFPGRAPEGHVALTVMIGGLRAPTLARLPVDELLAAVRPDLQALLGVRGDPVFRRHRFWPRAIPQYQLGYERFLGAMAACERAHPGLLIGGQARDGISVPACLAAGEALARRAAR